MSLNDPRMSVPSRMWSRLVVLARNTALGACIGLIFGLLLSCWVVVLVFVNRSLVLHTSSGTALNALAAIAYYVLGGIVAGSIVGFLYPLLRWRIGAVLIGLIASVPLCAAGLWMLGGFGPWDPADNLTLLFCTAALGVGGGLGLWYVINKD